MCPLPQNDTLMLETMAVLSCNRPLVWCRMRVGEEDANLMGLRSHVHDGASEALLILCLCMEAGGRGFKTVYSKSPGGEVMWKQFLEFWWAAIRGWGFLIYKMGIMISHSALEDGIGGFLVVLWLGLCTATAGRVGSIPGWGTNIPQALVPPCRKRLNQKMSWKHLCIVPWYRGNV